jgi:D-alanyl-D-alanine carboxypeptidase/D-alanyl-D-alanine-endopeptidase (penicillin-binding protein 4)
MKKWITRRAALAGGAALAAGTLRLRTAQAQEGSSLSPALQAYIDKPLFRGGRWGLLLVDLESGTVLQRLSPTERFLTGSTAKIFSITTALATLGGGYRFQTPVVRRGAVVDGALDGDLVLIASGDLTMGGRTTSSGGVAFEDFDHYDANALPVATLTPENPLDGLDQLAREVARRMNSVRDVIVDDRLWQIPLIDDVPITPIVINDNLIDLVLTPGAAGSVATVDWRPKTAAYTVESTVRTVVADSPLDVDIDIDAIPGGPGQPTRIRVSGTIPAGRMPLVQVYQVDSPAGFARTLFIEALSRAGVRVDAPALGANPSARLPSREAVALSPIVAGYISPPYADYAKLINKVSHNLGANMAPLLVALQYGKRTEEDGLAIQIDHAVQAGCARDQRTFTDGQGLAGCTVSPLAMTTYLRYLSRQS